MEITALCSRLLMFLIVLLAAHVQKSQTEKEAAAVRITVDRLQFFEYESVSFHCEAPGGSAELLGIRSNEKFIKKCDMKTTSTWTCTIETVYESDSGLYWCETGRGERSTSVNITVTGGSVILETPAVPVLEGNDVNLHCRKKTDSTYLPQCANFYKDGVLMKNSPAANMPISNVSKSDEGFYSCCIPDVGASPGSWLPVRENHPVHHRSHDVSVSLGVFATSLIVALLLLGFLRKHREFLSFYTSVALYFSSKTPTNSGEDNQTVSGADSADDPNTLTYAVVVTKKRKNKDTANAADDTSLHLESNHSREPQGGRDKDGPVYSAINIKATQKKGGETPY